MHVNHEQEFVIAGYTAAVGPSISQVRGATSADPCASHDFRAAPDQRCSTAQAPASKSYDQAWIRGAAVSLEGVIFIALAAISKDRKRRAWSYRSEVKISSSAPVSCNKWVSLFRTVSGPPVTATLNRDSTRNLSASLQTPSMLSMGGGT